MRQDGVIIVGGGFSGLMLAVHLMADPRGPDVTLVERRPRLGRGRAYADAGQPWRLNVCAGNMSAFPADPLHFLRWLQARDPSAVWASFAERRVYGAYLEGVAADLRARPDAGARLRLIDGEALCADMDADGAGVTLADGRRLEGAAVVLAIGSGPPRPAPGTEGLDDDRCLDDPWSADVTAGLKAGDAVFLLGSGLTMVDATLALTKVDGVRVHALSRRGLTPRPHGVDLPPAPAPDPDLPATATGLVRRVRANAEAVGWRGAVDALRPVTTTLWRALPPAERGRLLRHARPWWDAHRHRLAPELSAELERLRAAGRLAEASGRLVRASPAPGGGVEVAWRARGEAETRTLRVRRVVNCTGLGGAATASAEPLLGGLMVRGLARPDAEGLGLDVDAASRAVGADGRARDRLRVLGPLTQGAFWEATAVPDLRGRALLLAEDLRAAHRRGSE